MSILDPADDGTAIREKLENGALLVASLCSQRCHKCEDWWKDFADVAARREEDCFVWIDVDDHPDLTAEVPSLATFPVLLIQGHGASPRHCATIEPRQEVLEALLDDDASPGNIPDPCIREFLLDEA